jgi:hypothetical protein
MALSPFAEEVWTVARPARFWGVETGSRMTVVRLGDGGLFVHSPVALDAATRQAVDALGEVRAVVAPSVFHHLHVGAWMATYPRAHFAACPGLEWKRPDLPFHGILGDTPHPLWAADLEQVYFSARRENEVVFFHARSRTLICCDAMLHLSSHPRRATRAVGWLMGNRGPGLGYLEPMMVRHRNLARRQADRILAWGFDRVILSHGQPLEEGGHRAFRDAYAWL